MYFTRRDALGTRSAPLASGTAHRLPVHINGTGAAPDLSVTEQRRLVWLMTGVFRSRDGRQSWQPVVMSGPKPL